MTPTLLAVLQVVHKQKEKEKGRTECASCKQNLDSLLAQALAPLSKHKDMHSASLPRNFTAARATAGPAYPREWPQLTAPSKPYSKTLNAEVAANIDAELSAIDQKSLAAEEQSKSDLVSASSAASFFSR